jgi:hypothetical protein
MAQAPSGFGMDYDPEIFLAQVAKEKAEMVKEKPVVNKEDSSNDDEEETSVLMASWYAFTKLEAQKAAAKKRKKKIRPTLMRIL